MAISQFPPAPVKLTDTPLQFALKGDAFIAQFPTFVDEANALATDVTAKQATASDAATTATTKAAEAAASAVSAIMSPSTHASSLTSIAMAVGEISFIVEIGKNFVPGMWVVITSSISVQDWMHGQITAYDSYTGDITVLVSICNGTATAAEWTITLSAPAQYANPVFTGVPIAPTAAPGTNTTQIATTAFARRAGVPVGSVIFFMGGYFTGPNNTGTFVNVLGNTAAEVNAAVNQDGFYVQNGVECNVSGSPIFDGPGRYLPLVTDDRFIMGDTAAGGIGGTNTDSHVHSYNHLHYTGSVALSVSQLPSHRHTQTAYNGGSVPAGEGSKPGTSYIDATLASSSGSYTSYEGSGVTHNHGATGSSAGAGYIYTGSPSVSDKRPKFIAGIPLMKVI